MSTTASPTTAAVQTEQQQHTSSSPNHHDTSAISQGLPSMDDLSSFSASADNTEKHPKGKRKRTATKDKLILEEAYCINPKPDKQARLEIVNRVSLNEKEVQIWFQNRRQNDRRKSRPLSPQELAALRFNGMHSISSDPTTSHSVTTASDKTCLSSDPAAPLAAIDYGATSPRLPISPELTQSLSDAVNGTPRSSVHEHVHNSLAQITPPQRQDFTPLQDSQDGSRLSQSFSSSVGYLANRWNIGSSFSTPSSLGRGMDESFKLEPFPPSSCSSNASLKANQSQSQMRLSLSLEGKAELVSDLSSPTRETPSRPSSCLPVLPQVRQRGLQRSLSALPTITLPPISTLTSSLPPRLARGRSRDVHAWELCADAETRDELTTLAENESNGSAIAAISLLRSSSNILQPSGSKRNAPLSKHPRSRQAKKPKLGRTNSSIVQVEGDKENSCETPSGKLNVTMLVSPTDSDKENWSPDEDGNTLEGHRRLLPPGPPKLLNARRTGGILNDRKGPACLGARANTAPSGFRTLSPGGLEVFEDADGKLASKPRDSEVNHFMRGEESPSKKGDLDCVAGLLSLSQGAWR